LRHFRHILILTVLILTSISSTFGQTNLFQQSIYFETAKSDLTTEGKHTLDKLLDSLRTFHSYKIYIQGNTDNVGDSIYNQKLSEERINVTRQYFINNLINQSVFTTIALGAKKPIADNTTDEGKKKNRRVDISISFERVVPVDTNSIFQLYKQTEIKPQEFCINPARDTILRAEQGTVIYVKANSFKIRSSCKTNCVKIKVKEDFLKSQMMLDNLSTTSNGKLLESGGMVYTEANDCKGNKLKLSKGKDLVVFVPTDSVVSEMKIFQGNRTPHDSIMNWTASNSSVLANFTLAELDICADWIACGGVGRKCPFFFCKIKNFFRYLFTKKPRVGVTNPPPRNMIPKCEKLEELYKKYGVQNMKDLIYSLNKPLMDKYGVTTIIALQDSLKKANIKNIELSYLNKKLSYEDFRYYVYNTSQLGWSNIDKFSDISQDKLVTMKINLKIGNNVDCKLVFKNRRAIMPPSKMDSKYEFENVPKGEMVWIVAIKYVDGKPYLYMIETTVDNTTYNVDLKELTLDELKKELKKLDE
jgi:hypothetical protein